MKLGLLLLSVTVCGLAPMANAGPAVEIIMEKTTYSYCEKLFYTINVSEITGDPAIIHIRDSAGKGSSAVPIPIASHETPVPSLIAFGKDIFPLGGYFVDVEYAGTKTSAEFTLIDSGKICLPDILKPVIANWLGGLVTDEIVMDTFDRHVDRRLVEVPFQDAGHIVIPPWVKGMAFWWLEGEIDDGTFAGAIQYLLDAEIIRAGA